MPSRGLLHGWLPRRPASGQEKGEQVSERGTLTIPAPIVNRGDTCLVLVNREWRSGKCQALEYQNNFGSFSWGYCVQLLSKSGTKYRRYVGDDGIKELSK